MGTYKGGSPQYRSICDNVGALKASYPFSNGYFGVKGQSNDTHTRNILSDNPKKTAKEFYDSAGYGGIETPIKNNRTGEIKGKKTTLADGTIITWREISSSDGSPAININIENSADSAGIKQQKIHFVKE